jgi:DNA-binding NarL/FixJ family response regulator
MTDILIADEHDVVRQGLRIHLGSEPKWRIVGEAADGKETVLKSVEAKPDVIVLAYELPGINGIEVTSQIRARLPKTEILTSRASEKSHLGNHTSPASHRRSKRSRSTKDQARF